MAFEKFDLENGAGCKDAARVGVAEERQKVATKKVQKLPYRLRKPLPLALAEGPIAESVFLIQGQAKPRSLIIYQSCRNEYS
jgi:hypothetical protein